MSSERPDWYGAFVVHMVEPLTDFVRQCLGNSEDIEDIVQDTIVELLEQGRGDMHLKEARTLAYCLVEKRVHSYQESSDKVVVYRKEAVGGKDSVCSDLIAQEDALEEEMRAYVRESKLVISGRFSGVARDWTERYFGRN